MSVEASVTLSEEQELVADWLVDETVPPGWSHRTVPASRKVLVRDPSGRKHDGRRKAILHLLESEEDEDSERDLAVSVLKAGLHLEGWRTEQSLPPGWRCRLTSRDKKYLSENLTLFSSNIKALEFAKQNYDEATVEKFRNLTLNFSKRNSYSSSSQLDCSDLPDENDETVPAGWTTRVNNTTSTTTIISPSGRQFSSRLDGLRYLVESAAPEADVEEMKQFLYYEQWQDDPDLPPGWKLKLDQTEDKLLLLTSRAELLRSLQEAFSHLRQAEYSQEDLIRLNTLVRRHQQTSHTEQTERTLPPGWKLKVPTLTTVEAPDGTVYRSRRVAFQNMIETGRYPQAEIELMKKYLKFERWTEQDSLPSGSFILLLDRNNLIYIPLLSGWLMKRRKKSVLLMARDGMQFDSIAQAVEFVQTYSLYFADDDIEKLQRLAGVQGTAPAPVTETDDSRIEKKPKVRRSTSGAVSPLNVSWTSDSLLPPGWKVKKQHQAGSRSSCQLLSPSGEVFKVLRRALKHLIDSQGAEAEISALREYLKSQGWKEGFDKLPALWLYKTGNTGRKISFLTDTGDFVEHKVNAISYLKQHSTTVEEDVEKLKAFNFDDIVKTGEDKHSTNAQNPSPKKVIEDSTESEIKPLPGKPDEENPKTKKSGQKKPKPRKVTEPDETWTEDESLPAGWRQKIVAGGKVQMLVTPAGETFRGKRKALRWMLQNKYDQEQISKMRNLLSSDGWNFHEKLPNNWLYKTTKNGKGRLGTIYCSPSGEHFKSRELAVKFARESGAAQSDLEMLSSFSLKGNERKPGDVSTVSISLSEEISLEETESSFDSLSETEIDTESSDTSILSDQYYDDNHCEN